MIKACSSLLEPAERHAQQQGTYLCEVNVPYLTGHTSIKTAGLDAT
jgi:hypothetical protein